MDPGCRRACRVSGRERWIAGAGSAGLLLAWGGFAYVLSAPDTESVPSLLPNATLVGAAVAVLCGMLHPRRAWTFPLIVAGGVFLGVLLF
ncbi:MAG: hypothetical protein ACI8QC_000514 [Planctomycetota bacterium]|jgi:hypothetical protein